MDTLLRVRFHQSKPLQADVTAGSDPTRSVQDGMQTFLARNGVSFVPAGNYQEMLNSALDAAPEQLLDSPQFGTERCHCGS